MLIAHLSDLHVTEPGKLAYGQVDCTALLSAAIAQINRLSPLPDLVVMTGDLVDHPTPASYGELARTLAALVPPARLIPGNHDDAALLRAAFPDAAYLGSTGPIRWVEAWGRLRLIGLDSTLPGDPRGAVRPEDLTWLDATLAASDQPTMILLHHPPVATGLWFMDGIGLGNAEALGAVIARHPQVLRLLCGHQHRSTHTLWRGTMVCVAPSTGHQMEGNLAPLTEPRYTLEPPGMLLHRLAPDGTMASHHQPLGDWPMPQGVVTPEVWQRIAARMADPTTPPDQLWPVTLEEIRRGSA